MWSKIANQQTEIKHGNFTNLLNIGYKYTWINFCQSSAYTLMNFTWNCKSGINSIYFANNKFQQNEKHPPRQWARINKKEWKQKWKTKCIMKKSVTELACTCLIWMWHGRANFTITKHLTKPKIGLKISSKISAHSHYGIFT